MNFLNKISGGDKDRNTDSSSSSSSKQQQKSGSTDSFMDKVNNFAGGGQTGEENEDGLDKAIDFVQEKFLGQGDQSNESAAEQAKDEAISDFIREKYKDTTGRDFPIPDKEKKYGL